MTQFTNALEPLPTDVIISVRDLVLNTPKEQPYDRPKVAFLQHYLLSREERLRQMVATQNLVVIRYISDPLLLPLTGTLRSGTVVRFTSSPR